MKTAFRTGKTLDDNARIFIDENAHEEVIFMEHKNRRINYPAKPAKNKKSCRNQAAFLFVFKQSDNYFFGSSFIS
jgi:hypothetical protein